MSSIALAFENPLNDPSGNITFVLSIFDIFTTTVFLFEVLIRVMATGFLINGKKSYLRDNWHIIDLFIVIFSVVSLFPGTGNLSFFKIIRMGRLLRPLRIISKNQNLKLSINALIVSLPAIGSLMIIVFLIMYIFAICAVNLLKGKSFYCDTTNIVDISLKQLE